GRVVDERARIGRPAGLLVVDRITRELHGDSARQHPDPDLPLAPTNATKATSLPSGDIAGDSFNPMKSVRRLNATSRSAKGRAASRARAGSSGGSSSS